MFWPLIAAFFLIGILLVHFTWKKKFRGALEENKKELAHLREMQREKQSYEQSQQITLFNSMVEGLLLLDQSGRIQHANRSFEKLFGVTSNIRGKTIIEALRNPQLIELVKRLPVERQILDVKIQSSEMPPRWFHVNASMISHEAEMTESMVLVFHDLTRLKELEATRQEFVANVSHELRTPLSMIKGYVETLRDGAIDNPAVAGKFLATIEKHADRLTFLIEDLLTISKLESGQVILNWQWADLRLSVENVIHDLSARAAEKGVTLENQIPADLIVSADFDRLEQVFFNLIDNAIKYGRVNGKVTMGAAQPATGKFSMWINDDGPGIPAAAQERIFERFFRVDKARSREQGGTGLGLAIVKHVIQRHGGDVAVESKPGQGTTFHLSWPQPAPLAKAQP